MIALSTDSKKLLPWAASLKPILDCSALRISGQGKFLGQEGREQIIFVPTTSANGAPKSFPGVSV
jgi:hypothetical protein